MIAAENGHTSICKLLIHNNADIKAFNKVSNTCVIVQRRDIVATICILGLL